MFMRKGRTRTSRLTLLLAFLIVAIIMAPMGGRAAARPAGAASGGTLIGGFDVGPGGSPEVFNPLTDAAGFTWLQKYFSSLVLYDVNFSKVQGDLASSWNVSKDGKQYTFHLRPGVTWSDGRPFTSADVKFTIDLVQNPASASLFLPRLTDISVVATPDPLTVVITLAKPNSTLLDTLTYLCIVPQHALASISPADLVKSKWWYTNPVGTGPFTWYRYVPGQYVELAANSHYYGGRPKLSYLVNRYFQDPSSAIIALRSGEIQFTYATYDEAQALKSDASVRVIGGPSQVVNYLGFNLKDKRFQDVRVRQAFLYAIDRSAIVSQLFKGTATQSACPFSNPVDVPSNLNSYAYNVAMAKKLLQEANWNAIKGAPLQILTYYPDQLSSSILAVIQQELAQVGITVTIRVADVPTFRELAYTRGQFTLVYAGLGGGPNPDLTSNVYMSTAAPPAGANYLHVDIPAIDQGYINGRQETDPAKRAAIYQGMCKVFNSQVPTAPLWMSIRYGVVSAKVGNFIWTPAPGGGRYYDAAQDWTFTG